MVTHYADRPENAGEGYKCPACGYMWNSRDVKDKCPACGFPCNPYNCTIVNSSNEDY